MRKGITPVIAIIVLLFITIALAGAAWTYMQGFMFGQITKTFSIPPNGVYCQGGSVTVIVRNTGYQTSLGAGDFIVKSLVHANGTSVSSDCDDFPDSYFQKTLEPGEGAVFLKIDCGLSGGLSSGTYTINLATASTVQRLPVTCP